MTFLIKIIPRMSEKGKISFLIKLSKASLAAHLTKKNCNKNYYISKSLLE